MLKTTIFTISLLTMAGTAGAAAITVMPATPIEIASNNGGLFLDVNNDGYDDLFFDSTYSNSPYGGTETFGTADPTDDIHFQGTTETTTMSISALTGLTTSYNVPYGWLMIPQDLGLAYDNIYSDEYSSLEECNYDYSMCDYYDDSFISGIMEFDTAGYIGFTFDINGNSHWGWLYADRSGGVLSIESWGWETAADTQINAGYGVSAVPVPAALYLFASGLIGLLSLSARRYRQS